MENHQYFVKKTYQLAQSAQKHGNHPFGALLVIDEKIVLSSENTVISDNDITKHAELNLVSLATQQLTTKLLGKTILYTSTEPCAMCSGAIFWAGISTVVYGCSAKKLGEITTGSFVVPCKDIFNYGTRETAVIGPILETQGADIHRGFWK
ncbi:MAG: nucleoside deaminase [Alcanivoracaceae bacterium]|nr:nucleoside deaminase [Alcanivoracaceae bacterium]